MPRQVLALLLALGLTVSVTGCTARGADAALGALFVAATVMEVVATASMLAHHDAHFHSHHCHRSRRYDGRVNYYYGGYWEYYDERSGAWYRYD